jgi:hypothetical protein
MSQSLRRYAVKQYLSVIGVIGPVLLLATTRLWPAEKSGTKLGIRVETELSQMYVPVTETGEIIAVLPLGNDKVTGVRLTPRRNGEEVEVEVAVLPRNEYAVLLSKADYNSIKNWKGESLGFYSGKEGDVLDIPASEEFGLPTIKVTVIRARSSPLPDGDARFCAVNQMVAAPNPGICMGMAQRGMCCRQGGGRVALLFAGKGR